MAVPKKASKGAVEFVEQAIGRKIKAYSLAGARLDEDRIYLTIAVLYSDLGETFQVEKSHPLT